MTISVIMSTYHNEQPSYLDAAMESIWTNQTRKPDQIVLVEDGVLPDELETVVVQWEKALHDILVVIRHTDNHGLAHALNSAIEVATGDLLARMDSDDISMPNRFKLQEQYMLTHPEVDILGGSLEEFNDEGTLHKVRKYPASMWDICRTIHRISPLGHPTVMFRRYIFDFGLRYCNDYFICEDIILWFDAIKNDRIINNMPEVLLRFRRNKNSMSRRSREKAFSEFKAYNHGIYECFGVFSTRYLYSFLRLFFRLLPRKLITQLYQTGNLRNQLAKA